eukprot:1156485-Pyramimonas_sp.AAC.1
MNVRLPTRLGRMASVCLCAPLPWWRPRSTGCDYLSLQLVPVLSVSSPPPLPSSRIGDLVSRLCPSGAVPPVSACDVG